MTTTNIILAALALAIAAPAHAATIYVANNGQDVAACGKGPKKPCRSIGRGLEQAADGDTVEVGPGLYGDVDGDGQFSSPGDESPSAKRCDCMVHVPKAVRLVSRAGATQTLIYPGPSDGQDALARYGFHSLVRIDATGAVFGEKDHGFTVASEPPALGVDGLNGVFLGEGAVGASIAGNFIMLNERGILSYAPQLIVTDNVIQTNHVGLMLAGAIDGLIADNGIQGNNVGLGILGVNATMSGNVITGNRALGLTVHAGTGNTVSGNSVLGNGIGVKIADAAGAAVHANNIFGNDNVANPVPRAGLLSYASADVDASGNYFGVPTIGGFPGDEAHNLGTGTLVTDPSVKARYLIAIDAMK